MEVLYHLSHLFGPIIYIMLFAFFFLTFLTTERIIKFILLPKFKLPKHDHLSEYNEKCKHSKINNHFSSYVLSTLKDNQKKQAERKINLYLQSLRKNLFRPLILLNLLAVVSPMLGLLGTIWGMSKSFASLSAQMNQANDFENLIRYLSEAMYATAFGIVIASLSLIALFVFRFLFEQYFQNLEDSLNTFIESRA
ncbi:hypothetical protein CF386_11370 [Paraphotobacterium marinum]|uniref:MotA/TolQ/ExbB proton channel domain-containing protein n=1 Tax=Paraphotobacterium marinum TaxID=1755811 RepID=A0A220VHB6_9GAMM|nr:MotA/TolQ/ExbB proton channel family protein [Paraphotobacterium marinum]ASK79646.1 hypothetical protein CF386_11370 [Paraphotobacterium marinum]